MNYHDHPSVAANRFILGVMEGDDSHIWGVVSTYDQTKHTASVTLQPSGDPYSNLPVLSSHIGWSPDLNPGDQVLVACEKGHPLAIIGVSHSDIKMPPQTAVALETDLWVTGQVRADRLELARYFTLPDTSADLRGKVILVSSTADADTGTADHLYVCLQDATGALSWVQIA